MGMIQIAIYAENTCRAGEVCIDEKKIENKSDDIIIFEDFKIQLKEFAEEKLKKAKTVFEVKTAKSILKVLNY